MGWRTKFVYTLIVYAAGFATAIYCLAPAPDQTSDESSGALLADSTFNSQEFAQSVNSGMHKAFDFSKEAAGRAAQIIREKFDEAQSKSEP